MRKAVRLGNLQNNFAEDLFKNTHLCQEYMVENYFNNIININMSIF